VTETVQYERDGHVALLTLNRPGALNAVNSADATEGATAFAAKRAPVWTGR
jgi:enoyl-CoA hydratase/carnithine racemase